MKFASLLVLVVPALSFAQNSEVFVKAPPQIDEALRERVTKFFDAHVTGKYKEAIPIVAPDALDGFLGSSRDSYKSCEISKINYTEDFTKATVTTACKGQYRFQGHAVPVTMPGISYWKYENGQWWWYVVKQEVTLTPWGKSSRPDYDGKSQMPSIPADPKAAARNILNMVSIDRTALEFKATEASSGEVRITNQMPGSVSVAPDRPTLPGMTIKVDHAELRTGEKAVVTIAYDPNDPTIACNACSTKMQLPPTTVNIRIMPTAQIFPVKVTFEAPAEHKDLPKLPVPPSKN